MTRFTARAALLAGFIAPPVAAAPEEETLAHAPRAGGPEARAQAALAALERQQPHIRAVWRGGAPVLITGLELPTDGISAAERAQHFVSTRGDLLGGVTLTLADVDQRRDRAVVRFAQTHLGLRVVDQSVVISLDARGQVVRILNDSVPLIDVRPATIDGVAARRLAVLRVLGEGPLPASLEAEKVVFGQGAHGVEGFLVLVPRAPLDVVEVRIDAAAGEVIGVRETVLR